MKRGKNVSIVFLSLMLLSMLLILGPLMITSTSTGSEIHVWYFVNEGPVSPPPPWTDAEDDYRIIRIAFLEVQGLYGYPVTYYVNPTGSGLGGSAVVTEVQAAFETWDDAADLDATVEELFNPAVGPVTTIPLDYGPPVDGTDNGYNEVVWKDLGPGIVAAARLDFDLIGGLLYIVEFDIIFNTDYDWSITPTTGKFDVGNVATHEVGHPVGLDDLPQGYTICLTMYYAVSTNDDSKQSLGVGDELGVQEIY